MCGLSGHPIDQTNRARSDSVRICRRGIRCADRSEVALSVFSFERKGDDLIVEARIDPKDIAYITPDQDVRISLTAYDASRYGAIDGKVLKVSADAVEDPNTGFSMYQVDVSLDSSLYEDDGSEVEVFPGMVASIDVLAGKRTVLEYIWQPMAKIKERAFKD
mgnify:CR=1 FL=1